MGGGGGGIEGGGGGIEGGGAISLVMKFNKQCIQCTIAQFQFNESCTYFDIFYSKSTMRLKLNRIIMAANLTYFNRNVNFHVFVHLCAY